MALQSGIREKVLFGVEICNRASYGNKEFEVVASGESPLAKLYRENFGFHDPGFVKEPDTQGYLWDELAAAYLIDPRLVTRSEGLHLMVDTAKGPGHRATRIAGTGLTKTRMMQDLDHSRTMALYFSLRKQQV